MNRSCTSRARRNRIDAPSRIEKVLDLFNQAAVRRRRFFHFKHPATAPAAIKPSTAELGSGTEIDPRRPLVLLSSPAVKKSVSFEPALPPFPKLMAQSSVSEKG